MSLAKSPAHAAPDSGPRPGYALVAEEVSPYYPEAAQSLTVKHEAHIIFGELEISEGEVSDDDESVASDHGEMRKGSSSITTGCSSWGRLSLRPDARHLSTLKASIAEKLQHAKRVAEADEDRDSPRSERLPATAELHPAVGRAGTDQHAEEALPRREAVARQHAAGQCIPCAWHWTRQGCRNGEDCAFCHICGEREFRAFSAQRQVQRALRRREQRFQMRAS